VKALAFLLLVLSTQAYAVTLDTLQQRFTSQPVVRAHFVQERQIKDMPQPLRSSGEMIIARDNGLLWQQNAPFPMTLMLNDSQMVQVINGQSPQVITAQTNPQMFQFNHLLRALFQADRNVLEQNFRLDFQDKGNNAWQLALTPITTPLDKIFATITLRGSDYLDAIELNDKQGDKTAITFSQHRLTPAALTDDERQRFAF